MLAQYRDERSMSESTVPEDGSLCFGDHRTSPATAATLVVEREAIFGKAVFAYWPTGMVGKLR